MKGIVWDGSDLRVVTNLEVRDPGPGEVRVQIVNSGVCHSDVSVVNGTIPFATPVVLGHEGAGVVAELGPGVSGLAVGDHVVLSTLGNCGACQHCDAGKPTMCKETFGKRPQPFTVAGEAHYAFANISSFAQYTVVKANQAVPIPKEVPLAAASLIGCGVLTGSGAVFNRAKVQPGESAVVIGVGGIGLNVIQALRLSGAHPIIAVDTNPTKADLAVDFGATHFVDAAEEDTATEVLRVSGGTGVNHAFECVGATALIELCIRLVDWGGNVVIIGVPPLDARLSISPFEIYLDKTIMGLRYGSSRPHRDVRRITDLYLAGRYKLDELVTRVYPLEEIEHVIHDMHEGRLARGVLDVCPL
jgi:S-(hydroxymethyl)glutathione dehydrogenase/alcohol dehydrogenase